MNQPIKTPQASNLDLVLSQNKYTRLRNLTPHLGPQTFGACLAALPAALVAALTARELAGVLTAMYASSVLGHDDCYREMDSQIRMLESEVAQLTAAA